MMKHSSQQTKALQLTIKRLNQKATQLQSENKTLKTDLEKMMEQSETHKAKASGWILLSYFHNKWRSENILTNKKIELRV